jgi:hypothetical protein
MSFVIRFVPTYVNKNGDRTLMRSAQGRHTFETAAEAQEWIDAVISNASSTTILWVWGSNPQFEVRPCPCWPGHFDPQTVWFDVKVEE